MAKKKNTQIEEASKIKAELDALKQKAKILDAKPAKAKKTTKKIEEKPAKAKKLTKKELEEIKREEEKTLEVQILISQI